MKLNLKGLYKPKETAVNLFLAILTWSVAYVTQLSASESTMKIGQAVSKATDRHKNLKN